LKKVSKGTARTYFQLTDEKDKSKFLDMTLRKTFEPEIATMKQNRQQSTSLKM